MGGKSSGVTFRDATDVAKWRLCIGCGACVSACPESKLELVDFVEQGLRPVRSGEDCSGCSDCVTVCPGVGLSHADESRSDEGISSLSESWGPVLEVWEGYATDADIRFFGSSAGLASALSLYCIERQGMRGLVHVGNDTETGYKNKTVFSRTRSEILAATGSRYSPASPCDKLQSIEDAGGPCVFLGKPCDVEGLRKTQTIRARLSKNVGVAIGIFCAGTPSTTGTLELLHKYRVNPEDVEEIRFRGRGWPGTCAVRLKGDSEWKELASYEEAWGFLQAYRPYRCYLCPDGTSEFADISCGDPWYRKIEEGELGTSLVLVRTEKGREIVKGAMLAGYVHLQPVKPEVLDLSQRELQLKRGAIWGRLISMRALGIPAPRFKGFSLFRNWIKIPPGHKARSLVGTVRRVIGRKYYRPEQMNPNQYP